MPIQGRRQNMDDPTVTIEYRDVVVEQTAVLVGSTKKTSKTQLKVLTGLQGILKPGRISLLLGPPKSGKTAFLRMLAGHLRSSKTNQVSGSMMYNGHSPSEFVLSSTGGFVAQVDLHNPNLTVLETLQFAFSTQHGVPLHHHQERAGQEYKNGDPLDMKNVGPLLQRVWEHPDKVAVITRLMGLNHCKDSLVGDPVGLVRGVSGGERKRLSMAEMLVGPRRVLMLDEISTGLDSATLFSVISWFSQAVHHLQLTVVASLLQPPPEVFAMFDDVILLTSGLVLYHGPPTDVTDFFGNIGFNFPPRKDLPSFLLEVTTPAGQEIFAKQDLLAMKGKSRQPSGLMMSLEDISAAFWSSNRHGQAMKQDLEKPFNKKESHPRSLAMHKYALDPRHLIMLVTQRQLKLTLRDKILLRGRVGQVIVMGLITGSLFYGLKPRLENIGTFFGVSFIMTLFIALGGLPQLPIVFSDKNVYYKHRNANMYPAYAQAWAMSISQLPLSTIDSITYTVIMYWLVGFYTKPGYFFTTLVLLATNSAAVSGIFRFIGCAAPSLSAGNGLAAMMLLSFIVTSGFALVRTSIPNWWIWAYWISPMAHCFRGLVINELTSPAWSAPVYPGAHLTLGRAALKTFTVFTESIWIWVAVGYMIGVFIITTVLSGLVLHYFTGPQPLPYVQDEGALHAIRERAQKRRAVLAAQQQAGATPKRIGSTTNLPRTDSKAAVSTNTNTNTPRSDSMHGAPVSPGDTGVSPDGGTLYPWRDAAPCINHRVDPGKVELAESTLVQVAPSASGSASVNDTLPFVAPVSGGSLQVPVPKQGSATAAAAAAAVGNGDDRPAAALNGAATLAVGSPAATSPESTVVLVDSMGSSLPFHPITIVFKDIHYFVPKPAGAPAPDSDPSRRGSAESFTPDSSIKPAKTDSTTAAGDDAPHRRSKDLELKATKAEAPATAGSDKSVKELEILKGVTGYCEPGRLLALMGGSGAGKTTLMDVLLGRKTIGRTTGSIYVNGHPKDQQMWARVCGYVEQFDIHSAAQTVLEALWFSARLRLPESVTDSQVRWYVEEVMDIVDLVDIQHAMVGETSSDGLSVEQRKRMTIAVELVANPAVIFMDEPTSGLDARAGAVVMKAVRNVARNGRTVMVTIHQPSIEIFEAFDDLVLLQHGGRVTYFGPLGLRSTHLIQYLEGCGATPCVDGINPATWMLVVTGGSMVTMVKSVDADFPELYKKSEVAAAVQRRADELVQLGASSSAPLSLSSRYAASNRVQFHQLLRRWWNIYLLNPSYTFGRVILGAVVGLIYASLFVNEGHFKDPVQFKNVQNLMGAIFSSVNFLGMSNLMQSLPIVGNERVVFYRERGAAMYETFLYAVTMALVEIPWWLGQTFTFIPILYFAVGFETNPGMFFYYLLMFFQNLAFYTIFGQTMVYLTPTQPVATVIVAATNFLFNLFNGFIIPFPRIAIGWKWMNRITPTTWVLYGLATNQLGAENRGMLLPDGITKTTVAKFMHTYFGYEHDMRFWCLLIVAAYIMFFRVLSVLALKYCNFYRR